MSVTSLDEFSRAQEILQTYDKKKYTRDTVGVQEYIPHLLTKIENQFINHFY